MVAHVTGIELRIDEGSRVPLDADLVQARTDVEGLLALAEKGARGVAR